MIFFLLYLEKYTNQLQLFDIYAYGKRRIINGIVAIAAYTEDSVTTLGHTPGHTMYLVGNEQQTLIWGDLMHVLPIQMPHPNISVTFDLNPEAAARKRIEILKYVAEENIPVVGMHIPTTSLGKISENGWDGYIFQEITE